MDPRLSALLLQQQAAGFADIAGARAEATIPVSDRLLNLLIAETLPPGGAVREVQVQTHAGNRLTARVRVGRSPLLPALTLRLSIEQQPELPASPVLVLRMASGGLMSFAGSALGFLDKVPRGIRLEGDRILVDIRELMAQRGLSDLLQFGEALQVTTGDGALILGVRLRIR